MEARTLFGITIPWTIPARHRYRKQEVKAATRRFRLFVYGKKEPTAGQWDTIGTLLNHGDPLMDAVTTWMEGDARGHQLFETALAQGIDAVPDAPAPLRALFTQAEQQPRWLNENMLLRGQQFCRMTGINSAFVLREAGLLAGYQISYLNKVLLLTGALEKGAANRIAGTAQWWCECIAEGGMSRGNPGFTGTLRVRLIHSLIRRKIIRHPDWDVAECGVPVNQVDMAATLHAFSTVFLLGIRALGMPVRKADALAVMHLVRYLGVLSGIDDRLLCRTEWRARKYFLFISMSLISPDAAGRRLARALVNEPLSRRYTHFPRIRAFFEMRKNLSLDAYFLGPAVMKALGVPRFSLPWYPVIRLPVSFVHYIRYCLSKPEKQRKLADAGYKKQLDWIKSLM